MVEVDARRAGAAGVGDVAGRLGQEGRASALARLGDMALAFALLERLFWENPKDGLAAELAAVRTGLADGLLEEAAPGAAKDLVRALDAYAADPPAQGRLLHQDRTWLFYQVGYSRTSPYESVYRTPDRTLFGPTTAEVKRAFAACGLKAACRGNEPCDHFALECACVARVARAGQTARDAGHIETAWGAVGWIARFMSDHLLVFGPVYLHNVALQARTPFYRSASGLAAGVLGWAARLVGAAPAEELDPAAFPLAPRRAGKEY